MAGHDVGDNVYANVMSLSAQAVVRSFVQTRKVVVVWVVMGVLIVEVRPTIGTIQISREHILFDVFRLSVFSVTECPLYVIKYLPFDNRLMYALVDFPVFRCVV